MNLLKTMLLGFNLLCLTLYSQSPPSDFKLDCTSAGLTPWSDFETITILANGQTNFVKSTGDQLDEIIDTTFTITSQNVQQIWQSIQNNNFFSLNDEFKDDSILDGSKVLFTITANGNTKQVSVKNIAQQEIENIVFDINSNVPEDFKIHYTPPQNFNVVPTDPCGASSAISSNLLKENLSEDDFKKLKNNHEHMAAAPNDLQIPHGGVEIGYELSLFDAVASGRALLKSKGEFFGDGVSIFGNNTKNFPPQDNNTIKIKLNLEFYGPCDNAVNESKIKNDILNKWNGQTSSDGKMVEMEIVSHSHPGDTVASGTPGFDNIKLECGDGRSYVKNLGGPNTNDVSTATWFPDDKGNDVGTFAHEAGHLMGLEDQYDDWTKLPTGKWQNSNGGQPISEDEMKNLLESRAPDLPPERIAFDLKQKTLSIPRENHADDLMARTKKPPLQSDIDALAAKAGLIINIKAGDVLTDPKTFRQNLIVIHSGDLFVKPGTIKTLNGIYTACIDNAKIPPDDSEVLDIVPSLDKWNGVPAAEYLLKLVKHVDSAQYHCGDFYDAQFAVWRITDNASSGSKKMDSLFNDIGLNLGDQHLYFPKLINDSPDDTVSQAIVSKELFIPEINPKSVNADIGQILTFNSNILKPAGFDYTANSSWLLETPDGSASQISTDGKFTPDKRGLYTVLVKINITDPLNQTKEYVSDIKAFASVPDKFTETFEHENLSDLFQWETYGDAAWEITNADAQTGSNSIKAGDVSHGKSSSLAININLANDTTIAFAVKAFSNTSAALTFDVDSINFDLWQKSIDWQIFEYDLSAGEHRLTWTFKNNNSVNPAQVWLDNIFFPANSVVTSINSDEQQLPSAFMLYQNYPNPFNPITKIKYAIPSSQSPLQGGTWGGLVKLKVYDILGRKVATLVNKQQQPGNYEVSFDASNLSSGIYFYTLKTGGFIKTKKMLLLK